MNAEVPANVRRPAAPLNGWEAAKPAWATAGWDPRAAAVAVNATPSATKSGCGRDACVTAVTAGTEAHQALAGPSPAGCAALLGAGSPPTHGSLTEHYKPRSPGIGTGVFIPLAGSSPSAKARRNKAARAAAAAAAAATRAMAAAPQDTQGSRSDAAAAERPLRGPHPASASCHVPGQAPAALACGLGAALASAHSGRGLTQTLLSDKLPRTVEQTGSGSFISQALPLCTMYRIVAPQHTQQMQQVQQVQQPFLQQAQPGRAAASAAAQAALTAAAAALSAAQQAAQGGAVAARSGEAGARVAAAAELLQQAQLLQQQASAQHAADWQRWSAQGADTSPFSQQQQTWGQPQAQYSCSSTLDATMGEPLCSLGSGTLCLSGSGALSCLDSLPSLSAPMPDALCSTNQVHDHHRAHFSSQLHASGALSLPQPLLDQPLLGLGSFSLWPAGGDSAEQARAHTRQQEHEARQHAQRIGVGGCDSGQFVDLEGPQITSLLFAAHLQ